MSRREVGLAIQLAFYKQHASFLDDEAGVAPAVIAHIAARIGVPTAMLDGMIGRGAQVGAIAY